MREGGVRRVDAGRGEGTGKDDTVAVRTMMHHRSLVHREYDMIQASTSSASMDENGAQKRLAHFLMNLTKNPRAATEAMSTSGT